MSSATPDVLGSEQLQLAIKKAEGFISPVLKTSVTGSKDVSNSGTDVIELLSQNLKPSSVPDEAEKLPQLLVVEHALNLLASINSSLVDYEASEKKAVGFQLQPSQQKTIAVLLDIVIFEGINPGLSPGAGLPFERRPLYAANTPATKAGKKQGKGESARLLETSVEGLQALVGSGDTGLKQTILRRCAPELISGSAELAFNPGTKNGEGSFYSLLDGIPTATVLPLLTSLVSPATPPWLRKRLAGYMSILPMRRDDGVKSVIEFIVDTKPGNHPQNRDLVHLRRLLTSIPESVTDQNAYFSAVVPRLLLLLDVPAVESSIANVAAYVLGGLVYRWKDAGDKYVLRPIFNHLISPSTSPPGDGEAEDLTAIGTIIPEEDLHRALMRISALVAFPNRSVVSSVLKPVILSLWALTVFADSTKKESWKNIALGLLQTYFKVCGASMEWDWLLENLLYDGESNWKFDHGSSGGVEIRRRLPGPVEVRLEEIDERITLFSDLMKSQDGDLKCDALLKVLQRWLAGRSAASEDQDPLLLLKDAKVLQFMLEDGAEHIGKKIPQVLQLVEQLVHHYTGLLDKMDSKSSELSMPSLRNLSRISELSSADTIGEDEIDEEVLTIALNLLSTLVTNLDQLSSEDEKRKVHDLVKPLQRIARHRSTSKSLSNLALNISMVLSADWQIASGSDDGVQSGSDSKANSGPTDAETYAKALEYLRDPLVPVRAHGIHLLKDLIVKRSSLLDIPETVDLLLSVIPENDSFVYLNCISCLSALSERHPKTVLEKLLSKYVDYDQALSNDERLRIGEVLLRFVQRQAKAITNDLAQDLGSTLVLVAGRRASREGKPSTKKEDQDEMEEAEEASIRMRASALSILGVLMETNINGLSPAVVTDSLDIALHVLKLELGDKTVVTRRAAVVLMLNIFKGATENFGPRYRFVFAKISEIQTVIRYIETTDRDLLVKRNAAAVLESLDAVIEKIIVE